MRENKKGPRRLIREPQIIDTQKSLVDWLVLASVSLIEFMGWQVRIACFVDLAS